METNNELLILHELFNIDDIDTDEFMNIIDKLNSIPEVYPVMIEDIKYALKKKKKKK